MITFLQNNDYLRSENWLNSEPWAINKTIIQRNQTLLTNHLLEPFKLHARIDSGVEDDMCRMLLAAAIESVEFYTGLTINPTERQWGVRNWPSNSVLQITGQPVQTIKVTDADTGTDISTLCSVNSNVDDAHFYLRPPLSYRNLDIVFGAGFYSAPEDVNNVWTVANVWALLNVWSIPNAVIDEHPLIRIAILTTATDMYENRVSAAERQQYTLPSIVENVLRPIRRAPGY